MPMIQMMLLAASSGDMAGDLFFAIVAGLVVATVVVGGMIKQLRTAVPKREANDYVKRGSLQMRVSKDNFLYKKTDRTARKQ